MFAGSIADFIFPDYIGKVINKLAEEEYDAVDKLLIQWIGLTCIGALCAFVRDFIFSLTSERLGVNIRQRLYEAVIHKDISFFDDNRTGDIRK